MAVNPGALNSLGVNMWVCDWGEFVIPADVPIEALRRDGWFDKRRNVSAALRSYFADMNERLRVGDPVLTWREWQATA